MSGCDIKAIFGGDDDESGSDAAVKITNELNGNYFLLEVGFEDGELNFIKDLNFNGTGTLSYDTCDIDSGPDCSGSMKYLVSNGVFTVLTDEINLGYAASDGSFMVHTDDGGNLRFAIELDNADPGTSVAGVYKGVGFFNGSDHEPSGDDMRLESRDITNLTFANGDFALSIYGCENPVSGTYSFDNSEHGEFKMDITVDGCDGGDSSSESPQVVGAVSRDGMYVLISALDSDGKVEGIIVAAKSSGDDYDIGGSTFYGGVVHGEYTKDGDDWSVHAFADAITLEFDDSAGEVSVELHGEWNDDDGEGPGTLTYANDNGSLTVYDTNDDGEEDNLSGRVAPGGKFILLHKNNVSEDETEQDALIGVFIKQ